MEEEILLDPERLAHAVAAGGLLASVLGVFLAPFLAKRFGKKRAMIALFSVSVVTSMLPISARLLGLMPPNGSKPVMRTEAIGRS